MYISKIDNNTNFKKGLYFSKSSVVYNNVTNLKNLAKTDTGIRYLKDENINADVKEKFANIPYIKKLAEKFDTLIWYKDIPLTESENTSHISVVKVMWADALKHKKIHFLETYSIGNSEQDALDGAIPHITKMQINPVLKIFGALFNNMQKFHFDFQTATDSENRF